MKILRAIRYFWQLATCEHGEHYCVVMVDGSGIVHHSHRCKKCLRIFEYEEVDTMAGGVPTRLRHDFQATAPAKETLN